MTPAMQTQAVLLMLEWCCEWLGEEMKDHDCPVDQVTLERVRKLARQRVKEIGDEP